MTDDQIALARRAVACVAWRWMPGMKAVGGRPGRPDAWFRLEESLHRLTGDWCMAVPDLSDPATKGCLLALVREAWGEPEIHLRPSLVNGRVVWTPWCGAPLTDRLGNLEIEGGSEKEALVATLEAAP